MYSSDRLWSRCNEPFLSGVNDCAEAIQRAGAKGVDQIRDRTLLRPFTLAKGPPTISEKNEFDWSNALAVNICEQM